MLRTIRNTTLAALLAVSPSAMADDDAAAVERLANGRRTPDEQRVILAFNTVSILDTVPFIVEATGKIVMPIDSGLLGRTNITLVNDVQIDYDEALNRLFEAFKLNGVGVIEDYDRIIIAALDNMPEHNPPVIGPEQSVTGRTDRGTIVTKIFAVEHAEADQLFEALNEIKPDHATMHVDDNSNQLVVTADIGFCQRLHEMLHEMDCNNAMPRRQTFRLAHVDAGSVAQNIEDIFGGSSTSSGNAPPVRRGRQPNQARQRVNPAAAPGRPLTGPGPRADLRIAVSGETNAVTVSGPPPIVEEIARLIAEEWDLPRSETTRKVYRLAYTDPIKMETTLHNLLSSGQTTTSRARGDAGSNRSSGAVEGLDGKYVIEAFPDTNSLVVICKTEECFEFLDSLIQELDQPNDPLLPIVVPLKHADAEEIADQIGTIFAGAGASVNMPRRPRGVGSFELEGPSGAGSNQEDAPESGQDAPGGNPPWLPRSNDTEEAPDSPLIGQIRIVPIYRQNAVMILAAPEYRDAVHGLIVNELDRPGRQVLITATIAEVELTDELALGLRVSNSGTIAGGAPVDNRIGAGLQFSGLVDDFLGGIFDTSTLDVNVDVNAVLQALAQKTKIRVLQEPSVFTSDNQEAAFFEGQDVPVLESSLTTAEGSVNEATQYFPVGIGLNVRPRITIEGHVDMEVNLVISSIDVAASAVSPSPVFDRRETNTQIIVKDGQTIVIAGIMRDLESKIERKVPFIGDIPIVGELFKSYEDQTTRTELVAFITPIVVDNPGDNDVNFNEGRRQRLEEIRQPLDSIKSGSE